MENTGKVLFEKDSPQWYIAEGDHWVGPLTAADVYQKVLSQEVSWAHFVWKPGQAGWERICDVKTFQAAVPQLPGREVQKEVKAAAKPQVRTAQVPARAMAKKSATREIDASQIQSKELQEEKKWFLHFNDSQFGPFSKSEVNRFLKTGKINGRVYAWCDGMGNWERLEKLSEFDVPKTAAARAATTKVPSKGAERREIPRLEHRGAPRRPLVARILMAHNEGVATAMCRDISIGGMQALTDKIPGPVGTRIKMNVSATGDQGKLEPFTAEGVIVRLLEDGRGFSFRFEKLTENAKRAIESYIQSAS